MDSTGQLRPCPVVCIYVPNKELLATALTKRKQAKMCDNKIFFIYAQVFFHSTNTNGSKQTKNQIDKKSTRIQVAPSVQCCKVWLTPCSNAAKTRNP